MIGIYDRRAIIGSNLLYMSESGEYELEGKISELPLPTSPV